MFGAPLVDGFSHFPRNYTRSEVSLSEAVMLFWASFARTGWVIRSLASLALASNLFCFVRASGTKIMRCPRRDEQFLLLLCARIALTSKSEFFYPQAKVFLALAKRHFCRGIFFNGKVLLEIVGMVLVFNWFLACRDPNEHMKQEGILTGSKERNRFRNIVWEEYDAVHQKYLEIGRDVFKIPL